MQPGKWNVTIIKGATYERTLAWTDDDEAPVDLTGSTIEWRFGVIGADVTESFAGEILDAEAGSFKLEIAAEATATLLDEAPIHQRIHQVYVTMSNGDVHRLLEGTVKVSEDL